MAEIIKNRYEFVILYDVKNGNPNGDPDGGNMPRIDPETGYGIVTDVCIKRKIRNYVEIVKEDKSPFRIYVREKSVLADRRKPAYDAVGNVEDKPDRMSKADKLDRMRREARKWMCGNFFDVRTFGAVMSTTGNNCGQVRGPVQLAFSQSIDPVVPLVATITRMAVETAKEAEKQEGENRMMGRKDYIPYGLYRGHGFVSVPFARDTGFTTEDLKLLWEALLNMFEHDHSASRGEMALQKLIVFKHDSELGNAPSQNLFSLFKVNKCNGEKPARSFADYETILERELVPPGVEIDEML